MPTVDLEAPAEAEIVLEGELLPIGWAEAEGRFGEFSHIQGRPRAPPRQGGPRRRAAGGGPGV